MITASPLTAVQRYRWYFESMAPSTQNVGMALPFAAEPDVAVLEDALRSAAARHEALRTVYEDVDGDVRQRVLPPGDHTHRVDTKGWVGAFDLGERPPWHFALEQAAEGTALVVTSPHVVVDAWGLKVLLEEVRDTYTSLLVGRPPPPGPKPMQPRDQARWERSPEGRVTLADNTGHWKSILGDAPPGLQALAHRRLGVEPFPESLSCDFTLGPDVMEGVLQLARKARTTPHLVMLALFRSLVSGALCQPDVLMAVAYTNRRPGFHRSVGNFAVPLYLRNPVPAGATFADVLVEERRRAGTSFARAAHAPLDLYTWSSVHGYQRGALPRWNEFQLFADQPYVALPTTEAPDDVPERVTGRTDPVVATVASSNSLQLWMTSDRNSIQARLKSDTHSASPSSMAQLVDDFMGLVTRAGRDADAPLWRSKARVVSGPGFRGIKPTLTRCNGWLSDQRALAQALDDLVGDEVAPLVAWRLDAQHGAVGAISGEVDDTRLIAHVVPSEAGTPARELWRRLFALLPRYPGTVLPDGIHVVDALPASCDCASAHPHDARTFVARYDIGRDHTAVAPSTPMERLLVSELARLLPGASVDASSIPLLLGLELDWLPKLSAALRRHGIVPPPVFGAIIAIPLGVSDLAAWLEEQGACLAR